MAGTDAVVLASSVVVLASCTVLLPTTGVGGGGGGAALPGKSCAMARFCCNGKILGKIANSTASDT
jgi:hypothetical protein